MKKPKNTFKRINPKGEPLTPEKLRTFAGLEHFSDDEAIPVIKALEEFAAIVVRAVAREEMKATDEATSLSNHEGGV